MGVGTPEHRINFWIGSKSACLEQRFQVRIIPIPTVNLVLRSALLSLSKDARVSKDGLSKDGHR
jgi:hypothetical protein